MSEEEQEVGIDVTSKELGVEVGDVEQYTLQTSDRVVIPEDWKEPLGIDRGDKIALVFKGDTIELMEYDFDKITRVRDKAKEDYNE